MNITLTIKKKKLVPQISEYLDFNLKKKLSILYFKFQP